MGTPSHEGKHVSMDLDVHREFFRCKEDQSLFCN